MPTSSPLARVEGGQNVIVARGQYGGDTVYSGAGAGGGPTAVAVVSDLAAIALLEPERDVAAPADAATAVDPEFVTAHYLRFIVRDRPGILAGIAQALSRHDINIDAVLQLPQRAQGRAAVRRHGGAVPAGHPLESRRRNRRDGLPRRPAGGPADARERRRRVSETEAARSLGVAETRSRLEGLTIEVPGSTSNLGAGFDALAIAVRLYVRVTVTRVDDRERNRVRSTFNGVTLEGDDYVARSVTTLAAREGVDFPALQLEIASEIPMQAGLGSSAAAAVAGLRLYQNLR